MASDLTCDTDANAIASLALPIEVSFIQSYMTWMEDLCKYVEKAATTKTDSLRTYISSILEDEKSRQNECKKETSGVQTNNEDENDEEDSDWMDNIGVVASEMNRAAMYAYLGDYESAKKRLDILESRSLDKLNLTTVHKQVVEYFRDSLAWAVRLLKGLEEDGSKYALINGSSKLTARWEDLTEQGNEQVQATLAFLKACLSASMKVSEDVTSDLMQEAIKLDPNCYVWYHYAYRVMRRVRRNVKRNNTRRLQPPSEEEMRLAKTAYDLCPIDVVNITNYALALKETLWMEDKLVWKNKESDYLQSLELFQKALSLANETRNKKWSRKVKIYLAELLAFGRGDKLDREAGKRLFDECAEEYPNSTFVLHKVGKLYHHGFARIGDEDYDGKCVDLQRARDCYKRAIDSNPCNHACLMDYLKLLQILHDYLEMIVAIEKVLEHMKRDYQVAKLHTVMGFVTWTYNPMDLPDHKSVAIGHWMFVLKRWKNEFIRDICYNYDPIYFDKEHPGYLVRADILKHLESVKDQFDEKEFDLVNEFIEELKKSLNRKPRVDWKSARKPPGNWRDRGEELTDQMKGLSVSSRCNEQRPMQKVGNWKDRNDSHNNGKDENMRAIRRPFRRSDADEDNDWRNH